MRDAASLIHEWIRAYNTNDSSALRAVLHPDVELEHIGQGRRTSGRENVLARLESSAQSPLQERRFTQPSRVIADGDRAAAECVWSARAVRDVDDSTRVGDTVSSSLCVLVTAHDGLILEYVEYG